MGVLTTYLSKLSPNISSRPGGCTYSRAPSLPSSYAYKEKRNLLKVPQSKFWCPGCAPAAEKFWRRLCCPPHYDVLSKLVSP